MRIASLRAIRLPRGLSILLLAAVPMLACPAVFAAPLPRDATTTLLLRFDDTPDEQVSKAALVSTGLAFGGGRVGAAAHFTGAFDVRHRRAGNLDGRRGTIEFWLRPDWNGNDGQNHTVLECGQGGGMLVAKDGAGNLRLILNRYGPGGTSELGVGVGVSAWTAGAWHHVAFTWGPATLRVYTDGALRSSVPLVTAPPVLAESTFTLGAQGGGARLEGWLDDLRIRDDERSAAGVAADAAGAALPNDAHTLLLLPFDTSADGHAARAPLAGAGLVYEPGIHANAVRLTSGSDLRYPVAGRLDGTRGTLEFWLQPRFDPGDGVSRILLACGTWGGMLVAKDGSANWRLIQNRWAPGGTPELGVAHGVAGEWTNGQWHHCAFAWSPDSLWLYLDGVLAERVAPPIAPPALAESEFRLGREGTGDVLEALVDELRVSSDVRTAAEIAASYEAGLVVTAVHVSPDTARVWSGWPVHATVTAETQLGTITVPPGEVTWTTADAGVVDIVAGAPRATGGGETDLTATVDGVSASLHVRVRAPVRAPTHESLPADLTTPAAGALWDVPVLVIRYFATADGESLDTSISPDFWDLGPVSLADLDANVLAMNRRAKFVLEQGSRFRAYSNPQARPSLGYRVVDQVTVYEQTPPGKIVGQDGGNPIYEPDWFEIFARLGVRDYVEQQGVKEVWVWLGGLGLFPSYDPARHHPGDFRGGWESNMASPVTGDVSNSNRDPSDLPVYANTYIVYGYNFRRSQAEAVHDHGHQLEAQFTHANWAQDGNADLFWRKWRGQDENGQNVLGRCGDTHSPPNTLAGYDYENPTLVWSDIADWTPDGSGVQQEVNVDTWGALEFAWPDGVTDFAQRVETQWYLYWMMSMPGFANGLRDGPEWITNWWRFVGDWDGAMSSGYGLHGSEPPLAVAPPGGAVPPLAFGPVAPNPATGRALVSLRLGAAGALSVGVYDTQGRRVRDLWQGPAPAGERRLVWDLRGADGRPVAAGVYLVRAATAGSVRTKRVCVLR